MIHRMPNNSATLGTRMVTVEPDLERIRAEHVTAGRDLGGGFGDGCQCDGTALAIGDGLANEGGGDVGWEWRAESTEEWSGVGFIGKLLIHRRWLSECQGRIVAENGSQEGGPRGVLGWIGTVTREPVIELGNLIGMNGVCDSGRNPGTSEYSSDILVFVFGDDIPIRSGMAGVKSH